MSFSEGRMRAIATVALLAAMTADEVLHLKPQNLVMGMPIRHGEMVN